jgi:hypothetical protein
MGRRFHSRLLLFVASLLCANRSEGFVSVHRVAAQVIKPLKGVGIPVPIGRTKLKRDVQLLQAKDNNAIQGTNRGFVILAIVLLINLWFFTIPPEIRRAHICTTDRCVQDRAWCYDCKTFREVKDGVSDYYAGGGGIKWDFSVEQK